MQEEREKLEKYTQMLQQVQEQFRNGIDLNIPNV